MSWTLTTSGSAVLKAGKNANSDIKISGTALVDWSDKAEGRVESETGIAWIDNYSSLATGIKGLLSDVTSSLMAMDIIAYDNTGYLAREADMLMNKNDDRVKQGVAILKELTRKTLKDPV